MARVKRGSTKRKRHKKILKLAKGFRGSLSTIYRQAKPAVTRAVARSLSPVKVAKRRIQQSTRRRVQPTFICKHGSKQGSGLR